MLVAHAFACQPSSISSRISSLCFPSRFAKGGDLVAITSYHQSQMFFLFPKILVYFVSSFSREGNSVAASSSSNWMAGFVSLIVSTEVCIWVKKVNFSVSSVLEFSLHCSNSSVVLEKVSNMVSFTLRSPRGEPCVCHVCSSLSQASICSLSLSK